MPVATTETRILPSRSGLNAEPQMMLASGSTSSRMWFAASSTSSSFMSSPPMIEMITPLAPCIETPSSSGLAIAFSAASSARFSPSPSPVPIIALPISPITERTSAKSRLIRPGMTIRSVIERTPCCSTSSASWNASLKVVSALATRNRFWLGMTISVSTCFCSSSMPASAARMRRVPSNRNGLVTTPTVSTPLRARGLGDDRRRAGAGAAAHAGGDEAHVARLRARARYPRPSLPPRRGRLRAANRRRGPG